MRLTPSATITIATSSRSTASDCSTPTSAGSVSRTVNGGRRGAVGAHDDEQADHGVAGTASLRRRGALEHLDLGVRAERLHRAPSACARAVAESSRVEVPFAGNALELRGA